MDAGGHKGRRFVKIEASVLYGLLWVLKVVACNKTTFMAMAVERWGATLAISKREGNGHEFTHTVDSDDTSVCVRFQRIKKAADDVSAMAAAPSPLAGSLDEHCIFGNELGRTSIFMAMEQSDSRVNNWKLPEDATMRKPAS